MIAIQKDYHIETFFIKNLAMFSLLNSGKELFLIAYTSICIMSDCGKIYRKKIFSPSSTFTHLIGGLLLPYHCSLIKTNIFPNPCI